MADSVRITNMPDSGSPARVAGSAFKDHVEARLQLYVACRNAVEHGIVDVTKIS